MYKVLLTGFGKDMCHQDKVIEAFKGIAEVYVYNEIESRDELLKLVPDMDAIITDTERIDEEVISAAKKLKIISELGVGVDNIDLESATKHGVYVCNVPNVSTRDVAEHAAALILAACRCVYAGIKGVKEEGLWDSALMHPKRLSGKKLGLIGCGRIGKTLVKFLSGFDLEIMVYDPYLADDTSHELNIQRVNLDELLHKSDIISLHLPKTTETENMISYQQFHLMKKGVIIINVSRGGIINEDALLWALNEGIVYTAGLDVLENEPYISDNKLVQHPRALITPHIGWKSEISPLEIQLEGAMNVIHYLRDGVLRNVCNEELMTD